MVRRLLLSLILAVGTGPINFAQNSEKERRVADSAALSAQERAINTLKQRLIKPKSHNERVTLLLRMAELQVERAAVVFRIVTSSRTGEDRIKRAHREGIASLTELIPLQKDPSLTSRALLLRAQSYAEIQDKSLSKTDFLRVTREFPNSLEAIPSHMALAEMAMQANAFAEAISHLNKVEESPDSPHYPFALYKLGWAHFNSTHIARAIHYAETTARFYAERATEGQTGPNAFQENALLDLPVFYVEGLEQNISGFSVADGFERIERAASHPSSMSIQGKVHLRYAKLLRSRGRSQDVLDHADRVFRIHSKRPDSIEVAQSGIEYFHQKRDRERLAKLTANLGALYSDTRETKGYSEPWENLRAVVIASAQEVDKQIIKNKNNPQIKPFSEYLSQLVEIFFSISDRKDIRVAKLVHNLGETLFATGDFVGARARYRQAAELAPSQEAKDLKFIQELQEKALSASYQALKLAKQIPDSIEVKALKASESISSRDPLKLAELKLEKELALWASETVQSKKATHAFKFEALRTLYFHLGPDAAVKDVLTFADRYAGTEHGVAAAQLVLDTLVKSERWAETESVAYDLSRTKSYGAQFTNQARTLAAASLFKLIALAQADTRNDEVVSLSSTYISRYGDTSADSASVRLFRAQSYRRTGNAADASADLEKIRGNTNVKIAAASAQLRATLSEEQFKLEQAAGEFAVLKDDALAELTQPARSRVVSLFWATANRSALESAQGASLCKSIESLCKELLSRIQPSTPEKPAKISKDREVRALMKELRAHMKSAKEKKAFEVLELSRLIDTANEHRWIATHSDILRVAIGRLYKIDKKGVNFPVRLELIREFEKILTNLAENSFARTRVSALMQTALLYSDLVTELSGKPEMLEVAEVKQAVEAFHGKSKELFKAAFKIASSARIENGDLTELKRHASEASIFESEELATLNQSISMNSQVRFELQSADSSSVTQWKTEMLKALNQNQLRIAGLLLVEGARTFGEDSPMVRRARALFLVKVGAQAEGFAEDASIAETLALTQK
jgi:tetratricopeptide (TPR) repeat protein